MPQIPARVEQNVNFVKRKQYEANNEQRDGMECVLVVIIILLFMLNSRKVW